MALEKRTELNKKKLSPSDLNYWIGVSVVVYCEFQKAELLYEQVDIWCWHFVGDNNNINPDSCSGS